MIKLYFVIIKKIKPKGDKEMKRIILGSLASIMVLSFTACDDKKVVIEKNYTVEDFTKDKKLRMEYFKKCKKGELHPDNLNCINVKKAQHRITLNNTKSKPEHDLSKYIVKTPKDKK